MLVGYVGSFLVLLMSLGGSMGLGVGYGIWGASGVALTAVMSLVVFGGPIAPLMAVGIVLVVLLVEIGSQAVQKRSGTNDAEAAR